MIAVHIIHKPCLFQSVWFTISPEKSRKKGSSPIYESDTQQFICKRLSREKKWLGSKSNFFPTVLWLSNRCQMHHKWYHSAPQKRSKNTPGGCQCSTLESMRTYLVLSPPKAQMWLPGLKVMKRTGPKPRNILVKGCRVRPMGSQKLAKFRMRHQ